MYIEDHFILYIRDVTVYANFNVPIVNYHDHEL